MIEILLINDKVKSRIRKHHLEKMFAKQITLLFGNPKHPGLNCELLEPKQYGIYSFRIDRKFRGLFIFRPDKHVIEILTITVHYR